MEGCLPSDPTTVPRTREISEPVIGDIFRQRPLAPDPSAPIPAAFVRSPSWHPFLYRKRIDRVEKGRPGDLVAVYGPNDRVLGYGLYNPRSEIAVRMVFYGEELPDDAAWQARLDEAVTLRRDMLRLNDVTDAYRLIHAEADGLPGLVVDRLGDVLSAEAYTLGMYQRAEAILARLAPALGTKFTVVRPSPQFLSQEGYEPPGLRLGRFAAGSHDPRIWHAVPRPLRRRPQDGLLLRPAGEPQAAGRVLRRPHGARSLLLHRRVCRAGQVPGQGGRGDGRRSRRGAVEAGPRERQLEPGPRAFRAGRRLRLHAGDAAAGSPLRRRRARSAEADPLAGPSWKTARESIST